MEERPAPDELPNEPVVETPPAAAKSRKRKAKAESDGESGEQEKAPAADLDDAGAAWFMQWGAAWGWDTGVRTWRRWAFSHWMDLGADHPDLDAQAGKALHAVEMRVSSPSALNGTIRMAATYLGREFPRRPGLVNFDNGTLNTACGALHVFDPADNLTYCLPYSYVPGPYPRIAAFLEETIPDPAGRLCYLIHVGLALLGDTRIHQMVLLIGAPRSGKSTLLSLANALCGQEVFSYAGPTLFDRSLEGLKSRAAWHAHRLVCIDELPIEALQNESLVKIMSAHGGVEMRQNYRAQIMQNQWVPKLLLNTNDAPRFSDRSGALTTRLVPIRCPNSRVERPDSQDAFLLDKLLAELPGFAGACVAAAQTFLAAGSGRYPLSAEMYAELTEIEQMGDALKSFLAEECSLTFDTNDFVESATLYESYRDYCRLNGNTALSRSKMIAALRDRYPRLQTGVVRRSKDGTRTARSVVGLTWQPPVEETLADVTDVTDVTPSLKPPNARAQAHTHARIESFTGPVTSVTTVTDPTCPKCHVRLWPAVGGGWICPDCVPSE